MAKPIFEIGQKVCWWRPEHIDDGIIGTIALVSPDSRSDAGAVHMYYPDGSGWRRPNEEGNPFWCYAPERYLRLVEDEDTEEQVDAGDAGTEVAVSEDLSIKIVPDDQAGHESPEERIELSRAARSWFGKTLAVGRPFLRHLIVKAETAPPVEKDQAEPEKLVTFKARFEVECLCGERLSVVAHIPGQRETEGICEEILRIVVQPCEKCLKKQHEPRDESPRKERDDDAS